MISNFFIQFLNNITPSVVTDFFTLLIVMLFIIGIYWSRKNFTDTKVHQIPNLLTSIGILGTFTGIVIGLLDFHPNNGDSNPSMGAIIKSGLIKTILKYS